MWARTSNQIIKVTVRGGIHKGGRREPTHATVIWHLHKMGWTALRIVGVIGGTRPRASHQSPAISEALCQFWLE